MCSQLYGISQNVSFGVHIVQTEHVILCLLIISIQSYVVRRFEQIIVYHHSLVLFDADHVLL